MIKRHLFTLIIFVGVLSGVQPSWVKTGGGPINHNPRQCISDYELSLVRQNKIEVDRGSMRDTILFQDPIGNGGMINLNDSVSHHIYNYVDLNNISGQIRDYNCMSVTYDGHDATDIGIGGFYAMDEMKTPILAAAPGIVSYSHDGEYDRNIYWDYSTVGNAVIVSHADGTDTQYWHMKRNSVAVSTGDTVATGDTLGFVGSSGISTGPHLHFAVKNESNQTIDPWQGPCNNNPSRWENQLPFIGDTSAHEQKLIDYITTSYPGSSGNWDDFYYMVSDNIPSMKHINPGDHWRSCVWVRNLYNTDTLKTRWYRDGELANEWSWIPGESQWWNQELVYYTNSFWYWYGTWDWNNIGGPLGEWTEKTYINSKLVGEKSYVCDEIPNQAPSVDMQQLSVELGETITGEFTATDDGHPFWFNLVSAPNNGGAIELYGGRRRKFTYTAPNDFVGFDPVRISATDDRNLTGGGTFIFFEVTGTGLGNFMVEPTYVGPQQDSIFISAHTLGEPDNASVFAIVKDLVNNSSSLPLALAEEGGLWSGHWVPTSESYFSVDLMFVHSDTVLYEDIGTFTSVGPLTISVIEDLTASPGDVSIFNFEVINNGSTAFASDVTVSFQAENMECIQNMSGQSYSFDIIAAGDTLGGNDNLVIVMNNECSSDTSIGIGANIHSGGTLWWEDSFLLNIETLDISEDNIPTAYSIKSAYPNPFNPVTTINYGLPIKEFVSIYIYDLMGRRVKTLINNIMDPGYRTITWNATNDLGQPVSAGMYIYTIQVGDFRQTKKVVLLK